MERATMSTTTRLAMGLAGVVGLLLMLDLAPGLQRLLEPVNMLLAQTVEYLVARMGIPVMRSGTVLMHPEGFGYRIDYLCSGIQPAALIAITILVVQATWAQRIVGIFMALVCVEAFNVGRLVHLYWLGVHRPEAFFVAHDITWNVLAVLAGLAYLGTWLTLSGRRIGAEGRVPSTRGVPEYLHPGRCPSL